MSAFKAANPDAIFEDFIRWHSPGDWENEAEGNNKCSDHEIKGKNREWPPHGRLSQRMSEGGNSWRQIWNHSPPLPVFDQKPLFDPNREGEKVLHYLETLRPHQLLEQMVCTAFRAAVDTLNQTSFGDLKQMATKVDQLYLTVASTLRPLQGKHLHDKGEVMDDLRRLCVVFEHVKKLMLFAASIHRKLLHAPLLSQAIFSDYYSFYVPRMAMGSDAVDTGKEFNVRQQVRISERHVVANMFPPPTANQSWRKVLSMGNLLNGHEPMLREIIFSLYDDLSGGHYGASSSRGPHRDIETHRMYICGTSNDLQLALSTARNRGKERFLLEHGQGQVTSQPEEIWGNFFCACLSSMSQTLEMRWSKAERGGFPTHVYFQHLSVYPPREKSMKQFLLHTPLRLHAYACTPFENHTSHLISSPLISSPATKQPANGAEAALQGLATRSKDTLQQVHRHHTDKRYRQHQRHTTRPLADFDVEFLIGGVERLDELGHATGQPL
ncbi:hypothetical protein ACLOJK_031637 [Asimina triloba]